MISVTKEFSDVELMDGFILSYLKEYAPAGYDTRVTISFEQSYEEWKENKRRYIVEINRLESCD